MTAKLYKYLMVGLLFGMVCGTNAQAWWKEEWTARRKITLDTSDKGVAITDPMGTTQVLVRLHDGNFQFAGSKEDGSDIRFIAADDKTPLTFHIERYDSLLSVAFVWVKMPNLNPGQVATFWIYYGNPNAPRVDDPKNTYDADTVLVYHFSEQNQPASDSTSQGNNAKNAGKSADASFIGGGLVSDGKSPITIPASPSLEWTAGGELTWSAWVKLSALQPNAVIFSRRDAKGSFVIGADNGVPFVEVGNGGAPQRSSGGAPVPINSWVHLAVLAQGPKITLYLNGDSYATLNAGLPALNSDAFLCGTDDAAAKNGLNGELDELEISKVARPAGYIKLAAVSQSADGGPKMLQFTADEVQQASPVAEQFSLFLGIAKSLTFDGWIVIALCSLLAVVGWAVTINKFIYLNRIEKGTSVFEKQWRQISGDLTILDHGDADNVKSFGGVADAKAQKFMRMSPLYHIYHLGSEEIHNRIVRSNGNFRGLTGRSIQAIRTSLDGGLTREIHALHSNLIFLTIGIAGGPYLGLLGTVIGVMITFATIAKTGQVEVNSIAPGIAGALLATVAGLAVAIPALFAYSYLNSRIKDSISVMQMFIDEFVTKMAELYPSDIE